MEEQTSTRDWLSDPIVCWGEFHLLDGVNLLRSDDGQFIACWYEGHETVWLLDAASLGWPVFPLTVPPNLAGAGSPGPLPQSSDGTSLVWLDSGNFGDDQPLLDLGKARIVLSVGEGIRDWGPDDGRLRAWGRRQSISATDRDSTPKKPPSDGWAISSVVFSPDSQLLAIARCSWEDDATKHRPLSESEREFVDSSRRLRHGSPEADAWLTEWIDDQTRYHAVISPPIEIWGIAGPSARLVATMGEFPSAPDGILRFEPGNRHLVLHNGEAWSLADGRIDAEATRQVRRELLQEMHFSIIDDRLVTTAVKRPPEDDEGLDEDARFWLGELENVIVELKELARSSLLRQSLARRRTSNIAHAWAGDKSLIATHKIGAPLVEIWSVDSGYRVGSVTLANTWEGHKERLCFSLDNRLLLVAGDHVVSSIWDWKENHLVWSLPGIDRPTDSPLTLSPDGTLVVSEIHGCHGITVSSVQSNQVILRDYTRAFRFSHAVFSPDGSSLAVGADHPPRTVQIWGPSDPKRPLGRTLDPAALMLLEKVTVVRARHQSELISLETPRSVLQWAAILTGVADMSSPQSICPTIGEFVAALRNLSIGLRHRAREITDASRLTRSEGCSSAAAD